MYFVDKVQKQGIKQRKVPVPKKFWGEFPLGSIVKIELIDDSSMYYVDKVQAQGKIQRRIPLPLKFWAEFPESSIVKVEFMRKGKKK